MNKVMLLGRICNDLELRYTQNQKPITSFRIAVDRKGAKEKTTDFFNIIAWNKTAEFISKYFVKGQQIVITGKLQSRNWTDNNGAKRTSTEVVVEEVDFAGTPGKKQEQANDEFIANYDTYTDELPF